MSDDLDIRGGGAVAVDTATLRVAAAGFTGLAAELDDIAGFVGSAAHRLLDASPAAFGAWLTIDAVRRRIVSATEAANETAEALRGSAAVYEIVELRAERAAAAAAGDAAALARIDAQLAVITREDPAADDRATLGVFGHWLSWPNGLALQAPGAVWWLAPGMHSLAIPLAWAVQRAIGAVGAGTVPSSARLSGPPSAVVVTPVAGHGPTAAPASLADAAARIPGGGDARIRVERYTMPDGTRQFAVYVAGTQTVAPNSTEPFDMESNIALYTGERSASYDATLAALTRAGAEPGDVVHAFGHSQGAMITAHLALEGGYDTQTLVSLGSPVEADVGEGTMSISLRHADDPVAALAAGGHAGAVGAPGSFVAERTADPVPGVHDYGLPAHGIDAYTETARLLDASTDARMGAVRELFDGLGAAESVEVTEYSAERAGILQPAPAPAPAPTPSPSPSREPLTLNPASSDGG